MYNEIYKGIELIWEFLAAFLLSLLLFRKEEGKNSSQVCKVCSLYSLNQNLDSLSLYIFKELSVSSLKSSEHNQRYAKYLT